MVGKDTNDGVCLLLLTIDADVLLQKRSARKKLYPSLWSPTVSGAIMDGETATVAILRETLEEIGLEFDSLKKFGGYYRLGGFSRQTATFRCEESLHDKMFLYLSIVERDILDILVPSEREVDELRWFRLVDAISLTDRTPLLNQVVTFLVQKVLYGIDSLVW